MDASAIIKGPYKHTLTGVLGKKRGTMLDSEIQYTTRLAQRKTRPLRCWPGVNYAYGLPSRPKTESVQLALLSWPGAELKDSESAMSKPVILPRDFISLNKGANDMGAVNLPSLKAYRRMYDARIEPKIKLNKPPKSKPSQIPDIVFGVRTRPATPITEVMENRFAKCWIQDKIQAEHDRKAQLKLEKEKRPLPGSYTETRASLVRRHQEKVAGKPLWHMPKFAKKAKPSVNSFWGDKCLEASTNKSKTDSVARWGRFKEHKTGIYAPAVN